MPVIAHTAAQTVDLQTVVTSPVNTTGAQTIFLQLTTSNFPLPDPTSGVSDSYGNTWTRIHNVAALINAVTNLFVCVNPIVGVGHTFQFTHVFFGRPALGVIAISEAAVLPFVDVFDASSGLTTGAVALGDGDQSLPQFSLSMMGVGTIDVPDESIVFDADNGFTVTDVIPTSSGFAPTFADACGMSLAYRYSTLADTTEVTWQRTAAEFGIAGSLFGFSICPTLLSIDPPTYVCGQTTPVFILLNGENFPQDAEVEVTDPEGHTETYTPSFVNEDGSTLGVFMVLASCGTYQVKVSSIGSPCTPNEVAFPTQPYIGCVVSLPIGIV